MIRALWIAMIISVAAAVGAEPLPPVVGVAAGPGDHIRIPKTAEWEGEWVSVSSQVDYLESRGIFEKAAAAARGPAAPDIRRAFLKRFSSDIGRVRIAAGRFTFLVPDGSTVIGTTLYAYTGFAEHMSEGREIQWHRFTRAGGFGKYPVLVCSEPHGILGQWLIVHGEAVTGMKTPRHDSGEEQAMMIPADLSAGAVGEALDTPEFVTFLLSLPIPKKSEGRTGP
ncbi:MAG: hypothetical protein K4571_01810 [Deltaproteobacteria bacterium]